MALFSSPMVSASSFHLLSPIRGSDGIHPETVGCLKKPHILQAGARSRLFSTRICTGQSSPRIAVPKAEASEKETVNKVVLTYGGGRDTPVIVKWLREQYGCEVVCFTADVGQGDMELERLEKKAKASGASQLVVKDLKEEFVKDFIFPCLRAGAIYERKYLLGTSMARLVIAKAMVDVAREVGADAVAHGCTSKGNDQVPFELTFSALNPNLKVVAPYREDAIEYAEKYDIPVPVTNIFLYQSQMNASPVDAPNQPEYFDIGIVKGVPVSINGKELSPATLLTELNIIGEKHGIDYETPGGTIIWHALRKLESQSLTLDCDIIKNKNVLALKYADLVYAGRWFDPLREAMDDFVECTSSTGSVRIKLYKGSVTVN